MNSSLILSNILNPPVLFFFIGMMAVLLKSDLEIPQPLPKLFSLYLLFAIGFEGGHEIQQSGISSEIAITLIVAVLLAAIIPIYSFFILKIKLDTYNAAAVAAAYGSISAVTFITATSFLEQQTPPIEYGGHMVAALALMESPSIVVGLILVQLFNQPKKARVAPEKVRKPTIKSQVVKFERVGELETETTSKNGVMTASLKDFTPEEKKEGFAWSKILHEAFLNGSVYLLLGSLIVGLITSDEGWETLEVFTGEIFYGMLTFFLLDMGLIAARRLHDLVKSGSFVIGFSVFMPVFNALLGIFLAKLIGMSPGNALLFCVLISSASDIAVPAAMRMTLPEANPSLYISMALALTFPFNIIIGIPIYMEIINQMWN